MTLPINRQHTVSSDHCSAVCKPLEPGRQRLLLPCPVPCPSRPGLQAHIRDSPRTHLHTCAGAKIPEKFVDKGRNRVETPEGRGDKQVQTLLTAEMVECRLYNDGEQAVRGPDGTDGQRCSGKAAS